MPASSCCFFSSRRRHTRFDCDWSSDVCSSDLYSFPVGSSAKSNGGLLIRARAMATRCCWPPESCERSEERRVGKECRSRWSLDHYKRKRLEPAEWLGRDLHWAGADVQRTVPCL